MRVAIVENTRITHHGQVGVALHEAGARIGQFRPWSGGALPEVSDFDAMVVFGGEQNALDDAAHPYLPELAARMRAFSDAGRSVLGICLGAQILARGFGGENLIGAAPEFGWCDVNLSGERRQTRSSRPCRRAFRSFSGTLTHSHYPQARSTLPLRRRRPIKPSGSGAPHMAPSSILRRTAGWSQIGTTSFLH